MSNITLSAAQRESLLSLIDTQKLSERTQNRLATGRQINKVLDGPISFFRNRALVDRVTDFERLRQEIDQGISAVSSTIDGLDAMDQLIRQARGIVDAARSQTLQERRNANNQFTTIFRQVYQLIEDTSYQGTNLINGSNNELTVRFGVRTSSRLNVLGLNLNNTAQNTNSIFTFAAFSSTGDAIVSNLLKFTAGFTRLGSENSAISLADGAVTNIDNILQRLRAITADYGNNVAILRTRLSFTDDYTATMQTGADNLVRADLNEEGANLVVLQTRQQLAIQALSISGQQTQAILRLFN